MRVAGGERAAMRLSGVLALLALYYSASWAFSAAPRTPQLRAQGRLAGYRAAAKVQVARWAEAEAAPEAEKKEKEKAPAKEEKKEKEPEKSSFEGGFGEALIGSYVLAAANAVRFAAAAISGQAKLQLGAAQTAQVLLVAALALKVMKSAASRGRLSGTTFKVLNLGLLASFGVIFANTVYQAGKLAMEMNFSGAGLMVIGISVLMIWTSYWVIGSSYGALLEHGLPKFKMAVKSNSETPVGSSVLSVLAAAYLLMTLHSLWWGSILALYSPFKTVGALRCFVVAAVAHVCQTAAVAGEKRLASETYTTLNLALMLDSAARLVTVMSLGGPKPLWALPLLSLAASTLGLVVGKTYK